MKLNDEQIRACMACVEKDMESILDRLKVSADESEIAKVREAYELARDAHSGQMRKSGEPYIMHPVSVAKIVAEELSLGPNPIIAALLHDVVEDTDCKIGEIKERFGEDVAFLVGVVTKKKKEQYERSKQVDNYRQILASVQYDIRAILIKLADRLHNMRTLDSMRPDKQMKIAGETDYFYAPLANRLGLYHIKCELENLSFRYRCPKDYEIIDKMIEEEKVGTKEILESFTAKLEKALSSLDFDTRIELRYRRPYSVWRKMQTTDSDFHHVEGKRYFRIVYTSNKEYSDKICALRIYGAITDILKEKPGSVTNYIDAPKENGYQSFHVKILNDVGRWEEIHISSERMIKSSLLGCALDKYEDSVHGWIEKFKGVLHDIVFHQSEIDYMDGITSTFYNDDIMAFTPEGKGIMLPKGATALDFAFEIHSDLGMHAHYAKINGKLSSVKTVLHRGDCVRIFKDSDSFPEKDWLEHVSTYKAKRSLKSYLQNLPALEYERCPVCHPIPGEEVVGFDDKNGGIIIHKRNCPMAIKLASEEGDSIVAVDFKKDPTFTYPVRLTIRGVDRYHLLSDIIECITDRLKLSMNKIVSENIDRIAVSEIEFCVTSLEQLESAVSSLRCIFGVDEVRVTETE
ncbi:MAG: HD domain-containing protein [Candidatus Coprenecus sp.]|nr:HD domain-containing protein [Candidatus Coprenecus sp.]